jgi:hypothetical protein
VDQVPSQTENVRIRGHTLSFHDPTFLAGFADLLATRCVGPLEPDVDGGAPLLRIRLPARIGTRPVTVSGSASRPFTGGGFTGTVDAQASFTLRRENLKG